jgi:hypothetical protein
VKAESIEHSKQWMHTHSTKSQRNSNNRSLPARKLMTTVFWDMKGVLMVEFTHQGTTMTSEVYCETLKKPA